MSELAVGDENGGEGSIFVMTYVQQFDSLTFSRQALKGHLDIGETFKFDLEAQTILKPRTPLDL